MLFQKRICALYYFWIVLNLGLVYYEVQTVMFASAVSPNALLGVADKAVKSPIEGSQNETDIKLEGVFTLLDGRHQNEEGSGALRVVLNNLSRLKSESTSNRGRHILSPPRQILDRFEMIAESEFLDELDKSNQMSSIITITNSPPRILERYKNGKATLNRRPEASSIMIGLLPPLAFFSQAVFGRRMKSSILGNADQLKGWDEIDGKSTGYNLSDMINPNFLIISGIIGLAVVALYWIARFIMKRRNVRSIISSKNAVWYFQDCMLMIDATQYHSNSVVPLESHLQFDVENSELIFTYDIYKKTSRLKSWFQFWNQNKNEKQDIETIVERIQYPRELCYVNPDLLNQEHLLALENKRKSINNKIRHSAYLREYISSSNGSNKKYVSAWAIRLHNNPGWIKMPVSGDASHLLPQAEEKSSSMQRSKSFKGNISTSKNGINSEVLQKRYNNNNSSEVSVDAHMRSEKEVSTGQTLLVKPIISTSTLIHSQTNIEEPPKFNCENVLAYYTLDKQCVLRFIILNVQHADLFFNIGTQKLAVITYEKESQYRQFKDEESLENLENAIIASSNVLSCHLSLPFKCQFYSEKLTISRSEPVSDTKKLLLSYYLMEKISNIESLSLNPSIENEFNDKSVLKEETEEPNFTRLEAKLNESVPPVSAFVIQAIGSSSVTSEISKSIFTPETTNTNTTTPNNSTNNTNTIPSLLDIPVLPPKRI